ncbi:hypothetical protein [Frateuria defendens]|uniref:hypothetical protein n=1 Tax=Frateuria defendens TaxID=2219559 RepID=UPI00066FF765|nr:hypothetical protein [Frateuria defendens]
MHLFRRPALLKQGSALALAAACTGLLAGCANTISSEPLVKPSGTLAAEAARVAPDGAPDSHGLHLVYGYERTADAGCTAGPASAQPGPLERYGVTLCQGQTPLSTAHFVAAAGPARDTGLAARQRLAHLAEEALVPPAPPASTP